MQYAEVDGHRTGPSPKRRGACPTCGAEVLAKCGTRKVWHWAHAGRLHCDPWWENETEWHRAWKACFPEAEREHVMFDAASGEKHIADVRTASGVVLEFQNSPMSPAELAAREAFYGRMVWLLNAAPFRSHFTVLDPLPIPDGELAKVFVFGEQRPDWLGRLYWERSENPDGIPNRLVTLRRLDDLVDAIWREYDGHHHFHWKRPREVWLRASAPVLLDFGDELLWQLERYDADGLRCVKLVTKVDWISAHGGDPKALPASTGASPLLARGDFRSDEVDSDGV